MSAEWKLQTERRLLEGLTPEVLRTSDLNMMVCCGRGNPPSPASIARWQKELVISGKLKEVIKGVYLNRLGHRNVGAGAAAHHVRSGAIVSLSCVLEEAGLTNNFGDTITCVIPTHPSWPSPQIGDRKTAAGTFRFFGMPAGLVDAESGANRGLETLKPPSAQLADRLSSQETIDRRCSASRHSKPAPGSAAISGHHVVSIAFAAS